MRRLTLVSLLVVAAITVAVWSRFAAVREDLTRQRDAIAEQWTRVEAAIDRRAAAVPLVLDAVNNKPGRDAVLRDLAAARERLAAAKGVQEKVRVNREISIAIARLLLHCEADPKTRAATGFRQLQDELRAREDEIARERFQYNNALEHYNARMQQFPVNIVASLAGFSRNDAYFSTGPDLVPDAAHPK